MSLALVPLCLPPPFRVKSLSSRISSRGRHPDRNVRALRVHRRVGSVGAGALRAAAPAGVQRDGVQGVADQQRHEHDDRRRGDTGERTRARPAQLHGAGRRLLRQGRGPASRVRRARMRQQHVALRIHK